MALVANAAHHGAPTAVQQWRDVGRAFIGFGHPLYPEGDARAKALLGAITVSPLHREVASHVEQLTGEAPNVDFALAILTLELGLPAHAPVALFALSRCVGWLAHALEQAQTGQLIRPRARYVGPKPD